MKALSIRSPWWWFILNGSKRIENRSWPTNFRGPVLIHASKWWAGNEVTGDFYTADDITRAGTDRKPAPLSQLAGMRGSTGCLVGRARIIDCVSTSESPWFFGPYGFVLDEVETLPAPIPCKGMLGFFDVADDVLKAAA